MAIDYILLKGLPEETGYYRMKRFNYADLESYIKTINAPDYSTRRNYLGGSTELSEYITRGVISLPRVRDLILEKSSPQAAYKLINELAWREYWHLVWQVRGDDIYDYFRPLSQSRHQGIPEAILRADTGIVALDDGIRQLQQTGYIHNHMRLWLAGLICNVAQCDWKVGAEWMHSYLIDGDYASNHLSWQWVAGSYTGKPYLPQQGNINEFSQTKQFETYLDNSYEIIAEMPVPDRLSEITSVLPFHDSQLPTSLVELSELIDCKEILLYSPWTLDPNWMAQSKAAKILLIDSRVFKPGKFSQNVIDSILWFAHQIPDIKVLYAMPQDLSHLEDKLFRKSYAGISDWPGKISPVEQLYPNVPVKFYPSFSSFWKQAVKN